MEKNRWNLFVVRGGEREKGSDKRADNLAEAEKIAKELFGKYNDGDYCDVVVFCTPHKGYYNEYCDHHPEEDFPVWTGDCWRVMRTDGLGLLGTVCDEDFIQDIKDHEGGFPF